MRRRTLACSLAASIVFVTTGAQAEETRESPPKAPEGTPAIDALYPSTAAHLSITRAEVAGVDVGTDLVHRALGPESVTSQGLARMVVGRAIGPAYFALTGALGRGIGARTDTDYEAGASLFVRIAENALVGGETRVRGEAVDRFETDEDIGRKNEIIAAGAVRTDAGPVVLQTLAGWMWPRGSAQAGPMVLGTASFAF